MPKFVPYGSGPGSRLSRPDQAHQPGHPGLSQDERERIHRRASEGCKAARARGAKFGRKPKLTEHQQAEVRKRLGAGETCRQVAKTYGVHHSTMSRLA